MTCPNSNCVNGMVSVEQGAGLARCPICNDQGHGNKMNAQLLHILQHSLGVDQYGKGPQYRNRYVAGLKDAKKCRQLVDMGYMAEHAASDLTGGCALFTVTRAGRNVMLEASPPPPKLTRSQRRYRRYLAVADCFESFKDFLHHDGKQQLEPERSTYEP